ncbi:hypothetical protein EFR01_56390 [Sinorhizobium fredii]|nr:hypothetical protein EFR01_56390 [Sinorhizobium fredii]GLS11645.1 hypothetical protein GCM10007864_52770 [Sinorhizobium fredii]
MTSLAPPAICRSGPNSGPKAAAAWNAMKEEDREAVNRVFANIGKAIAAFERTIAPIETSFDAWVASAEFRRRRR